MFLFKFPLELVFLVSMSLLTVSACSPTQRGRGALNQVATEEGIVCDGSLRLTSTDNIETFFSTKDYPVRESAYNLTPPITITEAKIDGCGCFIIYTGRDG